MTQNKIDYADVTSVLLAHAGWTHIVPGTFAHTDDGGFFDTCTSHDLGLPAERRCVGSPTWIVLPGNVLGVQWDPDRLAKHRAALAVNGMNEPITTYEQAVEALKPVAEWLRHAPVGGVSVELDDGFAADLLAADFIAHRFGTARPAGAPSSA